MNAISPKHCNNIFARLVRFWPRVGPPTIDIGLYAILLYIYMHTQLLLLYSCVYIQIVNTIIGPGGCNNVILLCYVHV